MKRIVFFLLTISIILLFVGCSKPKIENAVNYKVSSFNVTDHEGKTFSKDDLNGKVWVANFIFTNCETVCPPMTANMSLLQEKLKNEGIDGVQLVSFSIDPEVDTPEALVEFSKKFTDDLSNWHFLTGYAQNFIEQFARESFHMHVQKPEGVDQVIHGTDFFLVNQDGTVVKEYDGVGNVPFDEMISDIKILLNN